MNDRPHHDVAVRRRPDGTTQIVPSGPSFDDVTRHIAMFSFVLGCAGLSIVGLIDFEPTLIAAAWAFLFELGLGLRRLLSLRRPAAEVHVLRPGSGLRRGA